MQYYVFLISLFEPFIGLVDTAAPREDSAQNIVAQSQACFEALIRLYYLRHGFESYDPTLCQFLSLLAYNTLKDMLLAQRGSQQHELLKSTLALCGKGLWDQGRCCYVAEANLRLLVESAGPEDAGLIGQFTDMEVMVANDRLAHMAQEIRSSWPIGAFCFPKDGEYLTLGRFFEWWEANRMI